MNVDAGGLSTHYEVDGSGPPIVLVHGGGIDLETWEDMVPLLTGRFTVYRYDLRGYGKTGCPPGHKVVGQDWVTDLRNLIDALGLQAPGIIGWAMGGCIGAMLAAQFPDSAGYIAMLGSPGPRERPKIEGIRARESMINSGASPREILAATFEFTRAAFSPAVLAENPQAADRLRAAMERNLPENYTDLVSAFAAATPKADTLERIRCPALILVGEHDARTPVQMSNEICKHIDRSFLKVLQNCGHFYPYEQPRICARYISEFAQFVDCLRKS
jgi:pimeloyl-ACP methyl ester carboxylesterase